MNGESSPHDRAAPTAPRPGAPSRPLDGAPRRLQGIAVLLVLALAGAGLARLGDGNRMRWIHLEFPGAGGSGIYLAACISRSDEREPGQVRLRTVLSRIPAAVDFERSRVALAGRGIAAIPDVDNVLTIDRDGRIAEHPFGWRVEFAPQLLQIIRRGIASPQPGASAPPPTFDDARRALEALSPGLKEFWEN